jgi:hypothetical protein
MTNPANDNRKQPGKILPRVKKFGLKAAGHAFPKGPDDGGGVVLAHAQVRMIYWGTAWGANAALQTQIDGAARSILSSSYVTDLSEYRPNIGAGAVAGSQVYTVGNDPANNFTDDDVKGILRDMMGANLLPEPIDDQHLFLVVTPPQITVDGTWGEHWYFSYTCRDGVERRVHYGWVTGAPDSQIGSYSCTLAHELVESITDPEMDAITFANCPGVAGTCEIGDVCSQCYTLADGTVVQNWYSKRLGDCSAPG